MNRSLLGGLLIAGLGVAFPAHSQTGPDCFYDISTWPGRDSPARRHIDLSGGALGAYGLVLSRSFESGEDSARFRVPVTPQDVDRNGELWIVVYPTAADAHQGLIDWLSSSATTQREPRLTAAEFPPADAAFGSLRHDYHEADYFSGYYVRANLRVVLSGPIALMLELAGSVDDLIQGAPIWDPGDPDPALVASAAFIERFREGDAIDLVDDTYFAALPGDHPFYRDPPFGAGAESAVLGEEMTVDLPGGATMDFIWIEPGTFVMGTSSEQRLLLGDLGENEQPAHEVTIGQGYYLGKHEITQAQWTAVMGTTPWTGRSGFAENPRYPAVNISWHDVQAFASRLNDAEGAALYRLPTEAEWEYAARAGTSTLWSSGDSDCGLGDYAWFLHNAFKLRSVREVGTRLPNSWGLHDMQGNVFEWCQDWRGAYTSESQVDPVGPAGTERAVRGGAFAERADVARPAFRVGFDADGNFGGLGARLLRASPRMGAGSSSVAPRSWGRIKAGSPADEGTRAPHLRHSGLRQPRE